MNSCRVLPHEVADGPRNMAVDEALLDSVASDPAASVVRTYAWSEPTLSLGYFQSFDAVGADPRWRGRPVVRRATGGGALWHDREITYAVIIPADHPLARPSTALYRAIHHAIGDRLRTAGVAARRRGDDQAPARVVDGQDPSGPRPFLCFADRDDDDIVVGPIKLVGSAQRRRSGAVLQHGSVLLGRSSTTPELPGLVDLAGPDPVEPAISIEGWQTILRETLPAALGCAAHPAEMTYLERERADRLSRDVYATTAWTRRR